MTEQSVRRGSPAHHRVTERFCELLDEDFGLRPFYSRALVGVPVKQALAICMWAERKSLDGDERGEIIVRYCREHEIGQYIPALVDAPPETYEQSRHERRVRSER